MLSVICNLYKYVIPVLNRCSSVGIKDEPECENVMFTLTYNTGWHVATHYDARKGDITFESCVIMNQWGLILWWIRIIERHTLPES